MAKTQDTAARSVQLRRRVAEATEKLQRGEITAAEANSVVDELAANTRKMRAQIKIMSAAKKVEDAARGRPALPEGEAMSPVSIYMKPAQREKLQRLGGAPWVRRKIDQAKE
jgi:hypothetical protein